MTPERKKRGPRRVRSVEAWIWHENLRPMFEFASQLVGYEFDDLDWDAVALGLRQTDYEARRWFEYPLSGRPSLTLEAALDTGTSVAWIRAPTEGEMGLRLEVAADVMAEYILTR
jgi:hypothetical protein